MIFFIENGRLGNQIIQYIGLKSYFSKEKIFFIGCEDLFQTFDNVDLFFVSKKKIRKWFHYGLFKKILFFLAKIRVFGKITEDNLSDSYKVIFKKGLFWRIYVVENFFYNLKDVKNFKNPPRVKQHLIVKAMEWFQHKGINPKVDQIVFMHIRRGDYLYFPTKESPAVLSLEWYKKAMKLMQESLKNPIFLLLSDDKKYLKEMFNETESLIISENIAEVDLAIMTLCNYGILSASTYSWCGAYYSNLDKKDKTFFIGPKYWINHRSKKITNNYIADFITYI